MKIEAARFVAQTGMSQMGHDALHRLAFLGLAVGRGRSSLGLALGVDIRSHSGLAATHPEEDDERESENETDYSARPHEILLAGADSEVIDYPVSASVELPPGWRIDLWSMKISRRDRSR